VTAFGPVRAPQPDQPITRAEAEALLDQAVRLAQAGDFTNLCESVASASGICRGLLQSAEDMDATPGSLAPTVLSSSYVDKANSSPTRVLHLSGVTGENKRYNADFAVIRDGSKGLRSLTAVYWSGVRFSA
jgi:hypothetical protein